MIAIDDATGKCKALEIFINDNLQGAAGVCGDGKPCGGAEQVPVQAQFYIDEKRVFETMMTIFQSDEFQQTLDDAAFSNDPLGSAIRLFENMGLGKGLPPEVLPKFRPVVEHFVTVKLNERDLVRIGLDKEKFELEVDKVKSKQTIIQSQVDNWENAACASKLLGNEISADTVEFKNACRGLNTLSLPEQECLTDQALQGRTH